MKRPAELSDADRQLTAWTVYHADGRTETRISPPLPPVMRRPPEPIMPEPVPPFPWRRFLAWLAVFAAVTLALALGAAYGWSLP